MNPGRLAVWLTTAMVAFGMAFVSPGAAQTAEDAVPVFHEMNPGSLLVFPLFDVRAGWATQLRITNTSSTSSVAVQLNFVCPPAAPQDNFCDALDRHISITPHGTYIADVATFNPPCAEGYVVAFAEDGAHKAVAFDHLIGSYHIAVGGSVEAAPAIAIQSAKADGEDLGSDDALQFGGVIEDNPDYKSLPSRVFTDFQAIVTDDAGAPIIGSELILLTLDAAAGEFNPVTSVDIDFWNADEMPFSTSWHFVCWTRVPLDKIDFNFSKAGLITDYGSLTVKATPTCPIAGACPPLHTFDPTILGAINEFNIPLGSRTKRNLFHDKVPKSTVFFPR